MDRLQNMLKAFIAVLEKDPRDTSELIKDLMCIEEEIRKLLDDCKTPRTDDDALTRLEEIRKKFDLFGE